jgi:hypothetical protein
VKRLFTGNKDLLVQALPWALLVVLLKLGADLLDLNGFQLSPLLTGAVAAEVFIIGFLLTGTASDFKEAERLPGEIVSSLETIADECLIIREELRLPEAQMCLADLVALGRSIREWLVRNRGFDEVMADLRQLNGYFMVFAPAIQAGFTGRLKSEQATIRRLVIRMDTMRRTSYVSAGYLIAEVFAVLLVLVMLVTDLGPLGPTLALVGLVSYLLIYMLGLIRDLDDPFEYRDGVPGAADVSLEVMLRHEDRMRLLLAAGADEVAQMPDQSPAVPEVH